MSLYRTVEEKQWIWMNRDEEESSNRVELQSVCLYTCPHRIFFCNSPFVLVTDAAP